MATTTQIPLSEYLLTSYRPDREFIDGEVRERAMGTWEHGELQLLLGAWFAANRRTLSIRVATEVRTQVAASRVRIPDLVVMRDTAQLTSVLLEPPLLIVEILSPDDTFSELQKRARDYQSMGVETIWIVDPETRTAQVCTRSAWTYATKLTVEGTEISLDLAYLFNDLDWPK